MKIAIGSDHAGFRYKEKIKAYLAGSGHECKDFGTDSDTPVDYPGIVRPVAEAVAGGLYERGIVLGGSGNGEAITANRVPGIRCTLCWDTTTARLARSHNDANMLSLGERLLGEKEVLAIVEVWLQTSFDGGRHSRRIRQIDEAGQDAARVPISAGSSRGKDSRSSPRAGKTGWDILIAFRYIKYMEGNDSLELKMDPGLKKPSVIHVPSAETWERDMPVWARGRRDEILARIRPKCLHLKAEWHEY